MKTQMNAALKHLALLCLVIYSYQSNGQIITSNKPYLFNNISDKVPAAVSELEKAFSAPEGSSIQFRFNQFSFTGTVISSSKRYDNLSSVIVSCPLLHNTLYSISKRINDDQSITYVGRILNEKYADGFELVKAIDGSYAFNKIKTEILIQDY